MPARDSTMGSPAPPAPPGFTWAFAPTRLHSGPGSLDKLASELRRLGAERAVLVCARTLAHDPAVPGALEAASAGRIVAVFGDVRAHSPVDSVLRAADALRRAEAQAVVVLGGGSAIVTARAASIVLAESRPIAELATAPGPDGRLTSPRLERPKLPQILVPSTPTTAMAKAGSAVFDPASGRRLALFDPKTRASAVLLDPGIARRTAFDAVLGAALNTFAMAVEGLESARLDPVSEGLLMQALRLAAGGLAALADDPDAAHAREQLMIAAFLAGSGTEHTGAGLSSVLAHAIGARHGVSNGILNALLLPHTMRFNLPATRARADRIREALRTVPGAAGQRDAVAAVEAVLARLRLPGTLAGLGVDNLDVRRTVCDARADWFLQAVPRPPSDADLLALVEAVAPVTRPGRPPPPGTGTAG